MLNKISFRNNTPIRTPQTAKAKHSDYLPELRVDFNYRCGYCDSFDLRRNNDFEVDHYRPRRVLIQIAHNDYVNLVYSCKSCNRTKSGKWPSNNENILLVGNTGFVDPIDPLYSTHFCRYDNGEIDWESDLGKWMYNELGLYNTQHAILWFLEKLRNAIEEGKVLKNKFPNNPIVIAGQLALYELEEVYLNKLFNVPK
ncbi:HNH endonuclease [Paracrocinitomix mangrovi]|uniref:HNH endonuclease n=1 Tax=Paracrocinitomix mangrovi TaxID=2862509 RepID=UPI001C8EB523|nr:HNH endonuclease [Paracrocinitomix mangrovi]UKN02237.1 HNH endonuclease [Paracrocinitomix mangrovi]